MAARRNQPHILAAAAAVVLLATALSAPAATAEPPPPPTAARVHVTAGKLTSGIDVALPRAAFGSISGRVVERGSGQPVESLQVAAYSRSNRLLVRTDTDQDGTYALALPASAHGYAICFRDSHKVPQAHGATSKTGWAPECYPHQPWSASHTSLPAGAQRVRVVKGHETKHVDARLRPGGAIAGRISHGRRHRAVRADVYVRSVGAPHYRHAFASDGFGRYRVVGLPPAPHGYQVCFDPSGSSPGYVPRCFGTSHWFGFPKQTDDSSTVFSRPRFPSTATHVRVRLGSVRTGIGARVRTAGAIAGRITDRASGGKLDDPAVHVYDRHGRFVGNTFAFEGRFKVTGLPPAAGDYVCVFPQRYHALFLQSGRPDSYRPGCYRDAPWTGRASRTSGTAVPVVRGKTGQNVVIALRRASTIQGTVTSVADGQPVTARVFLFSGDGKFLASENNADFNHPGEYRFMGLPASRSGYLVCASKLRRQQLDKPWLRPQCYGGARWDGARGAPPAGAKHITIGADDHRHGLDIALHRGAAAAGRVVHADTGHSAHFAFLSVFDGRGRHVVQTQVQFDGTWSVAGLDPARSYVVCLQDPPRKLRYQPTCYQDARWFRP